MKNYHQIFKLIKSHHGDVSFSKISHWIKEIRLDTESLLIYIAQLESKRSS